MDMVDLGPSRSAESAYSNSRDIRYFVLGENHNHF